MQKCIFIQRRPRLCVKAKGMDGTTVSMDEKQQMDQQLTGIMKSQTIKLRVALTGFFVFCITFSFSQNLPVAIQVDASKPVGEMTPFWSFFGYDEPNYTTRKDGQKL